MDKELIIVAFLFGTALGVGMTIIFISIREMNRVMKRILRGEKGEKDGK